MTFCISDKIRKIARTILGDDNSPYMNIPYYMTTMDQDETSQEVALGPPSMYDSLDDESTQQNGREKHQKDMRRQGPRPEPHDPLTRVTLPVTNTILELPRTDTSGERWNKTTMPGGRSNGDGPDNRDTLGFDPDSLTSDQYGY